VIGSDAAPQASRTVRIQTIAQGGPMSTLLQDIRFACRKLVKSPGLTIVAVLTLALGIGANTAIFGTIDAILLKPQPHGDAERILTLWQSDREAGTARGWVAPANFIDWRERSQSFEVLAAMEPFSLDYLGTDGPVSILLVRASGDPANLVATIRARLEELEPLRSVYEIAPLDGLIGDVYAQNRAHTFLLTLFRMTALALACLGIYGTLSYVVNLRRREVGLRVALGAQHGNIVKQFLSKALRIVAIACVVGLALSLAFARALSGMLYGVTPQDPATLAAVVFLVVGAAALAATLPAARAARIDPMQALRED
jgi:hypothetical protein